jgi:hypothetical protein
LINRTDQRPGQGHFQKGQVPLWWLAPSRKRANTAAATNAAENAWLVGEPVLLDREIEKGEEERRREGDGSFPPSPQTEIDSIVAPLVLKQTILFFLEMKFIALLALLLALLAYSHALSITAEEEDVRLFVCFPQFC